MKLITKISLIFLIVVMILIGINLDSIFSKTKSLIIRKNVLDTTGNPDEGEYPVILLHGFNPLYSPKISALDLIEMQKSLSDDLDYTNKGLLTDKTTCAELIYSDKPFTIRATYYGKNKTEINGYSQELDKMIRFIKNCTGSPKIDLITHSMGGIVARNYIRNIDNSSINKLIMLGTPNHGGLYNVGEFADVLEENGESIVNLDFIQMSDDHNFLKELNSKDETPGDTKYYTISGEIDGYGDGLVKSESVALDGTEANITVKCGHLQMKHPLLCPDAYDFIYEIMK